MKGAKKAKGVGKAHVVPGDILLGKYRVENKLGQGGMGIVVAARHLELGELFAIKYLATEARADTNAMQRFLREARSSARLKGEHAVKVHDVGRFESGMPYMIMEYLVGQDLKAYLRKQGKLSAEEAVSFVLQASDAVAEAHALGIIHRDLKPSNLFLTRRRDGTPCIKVLDFGIAKEISAKDADLTKSGTTLGSPLYMSPEQMAGSKDVDTRTDIWSLGVVLYELVTGIVPFQADAITELVVQVLQSVPKPPSYHCPELPPWIDDVVMHCLEKHPENRFLTMDDFILALQSSGQSETSIAHAPSSKAHDQQVALLEAEPKDDATKTNTSTEDVSTIDSSTDSNRTPARDKETALDTRTNPTWGTTKGTARKPQNRNNSGVMIGAAVAIVGTAVGAIFFSRAPMEGKTSATTNSELPPAATQSIATMPLAAAPISAPSAAVESAPGVLVRDSAPQLGADAAHSTALPAQSTISPRTNTPNPRPVVGASTRTDKKESGAGPQAAPPAQEVPPIPTAAPMPNNSEPIKTKHEGVL